MEHAPIYTRAEADLCLALEMLRNQPLRIASVAKHPWART